MKVKYFFIFLFCLVKVINARLSLEGRTRNTFDHDLYESVLDREICERQIRYMAQNNTFLLMTFLDASARIPKGMFTGTTADLGNYFQCLGISEEFSEMKIDGKYCLINIPLQQSIQLPFDKNLKDLRNQIGLLNGDLNSRDIGQNIEGSDTEILSSLGFNLGICIPKSCTSHEWVNKVMFNITAIGFEFQEEFCRLPNDKPLVAADYVAIVVFSVLIFFTALSTGYDLYQTHILSKDSKEVNTYYRLFSVYTNTRRLMNFTSNPNALECIDGIRSISMMWVVLAHTYVTLPVNVNIIDVMMWLSSANGVWITTGFFAVDTFFTLAGILLVYSSVGKMNGAQLLKRLHLFYLNRLMRMYPLIFAIILLEVSVFHRVGDGPYWLPVANNVEKCRHFWWSTLLFVQNYLNPQDMCLGHLWYLAVDIQLFILSPLILFWVLRGGRRVALITLCCAILVGLTAGTIFNFSLNLPSSPMHANENSDYMIIYYFNTLTRATPFLIGLAIGYILYMLKGQRLVVNTGVMLVTWTLALSVIALTFYTSYLVMSPDWDNQIGDNLFNSFMRAGWAVALGWIIIACVKGYGGPINWFLSLSVWKLLSRISYAIYLFHYPIQHIVTGMLVTPSYFSTSSKAFEFLGVFALSFIVSFVMTVVIDAPFSILIKNMMQKDGNIKSKTKAEGTDQLNSTEIPTKTV